MYNDVYKSLYLSDVTVSYYYYQIIWSNLFTNSEKKYKTISSLRNKDPQVSS